MLTLSNPRLTAEFADWPYGGSKRGPCKFEIERNKKGSRVLRTTNGKPKTSTYGLQSAIVDGADGRTYIIQSNSSFIKVMRSDYMDATEQDLGRRAAVFPNEPEFATLAALIQTANP